MASFVSGSDSDSDYGYDLTLEEEQELIALIDRISPPSKSPGPSSTSVPAPAPVPAPVTVPPPVVRQRRAPSSVSAKSSKSIASSLDSYIKEAIAVHETVENINGDDLNFFIDELNSEAAYSHGSRTGVGAALQPHESPPIETRYAPSVASDNRSLSSYVSKTKPRTMPSLLADSHIHYPDRELSTTRSPCVISN